MTTGNEVTTHWAYRNRIGTLQTTAHMHAWKKYRHVTVHSHADMTAQHLCLQVLNIVVISR